MFNNYCAIKSVSFQFFHKDLINPIYYDNIINPIYGNLLISRQYRYKLHKYHAFGNNIKVFGTF